MNWTAIVALDNKCGIGKSGTIPWHIASDLRRFKIVTTGMKNNVVIMGRKTFESIPGHVLPNRINIVLTSDPNSVINLVPDGAKNLFIATCKEEAIKKVNQVAPDEVFVIGGTSVFKEFADVIQNYDITRVLSDFDCDTVFNFPPDESVILFGRGEDQVEKDVSYRYETWTKTSSSDKSQRMRLNEKSINHHDAEYLTLLRHVMENGKSRPDRTGTGTLSVFAPDPLRFDISETMPLLTTKRVGWKGVIKELLWFLRGDTDAKILQEQNVRIWDGNTSREFLDSRGLSYETGVLGPGYGWQFRNFGAPYDEKFADMRNMTPEDKERLGGTDQIAYVEKLLKEDPFSRRIYINLWNAHDLDKMALTPCHVSINFYVDVTDDGQKNLSGHVYIRSNDLFLGNPYNIFSYSVFIAILALRNGMKPGQLIVSLGDAHIYKDHLEQVHKQLQREAFPAPKLVLSERLKEIDWSDMTIDDFKVMDYKSHPTLYAKMSV